MEQVRADRRLAYTALAAKPETAASTDLPTLVLLYSRLNRTDEALAVFERWIGQDVTSNQTKRFLWTFDGEGENQELIKSLIQQGKFTEGWQVTVALEEKLDQLLARHDQGPNPNRSKRIQMNNGRFDISRRQDELAKAEQQACAGTAGPTTLGYCKPLRVATEHRRISSAFSGFEERRVAALGQLIADAQAAQSTQHAAIARVYMSLNRDGDAQRELRTALSRNAADVDAYDALMELLNRLERTDEALAEFRALLGVAVPPERASTHYCDVAVAGTKLANRLASKGNFAAALEAYRGLLGILNLDNLYTLATVTKSLAKQFAQAGDSKSAEQVFEAWQSTIDSEKHRDITGSNFNAGLLKDVADQREAVKKPETVGKPTSP
jgi:tetratricopeptide (TPR) repeat protein